MDINAFLFVYFSSLHSCHAASDLIDENPKFEFYCYVTSPFYHLCECGLPRDDRHLHLPLVNRPQMTRRDG